MLIYFKSLLLLTNHKVCCSAGTEQTNCTEDNLTQQTTFDRQLSPTPQHLREDILSKLIHSSMQELK